MFKFFSLQQCLGLSLGCETCGVYCYVLCEKCFPSASVEHPRTVTFGGDHTSFSPEKGAQRFVARSTPSVTSHSVATDGKEPSEDDASYEGRADESSPQWAARDFGQDDIEQLEIPDLNDAGNLDDL